MDQNVLIFLFAMINSTTLYSNGPVIFNSRADLHYYTNHSPITHLGVSSVITLLVFFFFVIPQVESSRIYVKYAVRLHDIESIPFHVEKVYL